MTTKNILSLLVLLLFAAGISSSSGTAFNVTQILSKYPDFASFNDFLSVTGLADEINSRQTITVLAVDDSGIDAVAGRPVDIVKRILSVHVILDYFDSAKLAKLSGKTSLLTTLFQSSGFASNKAGFLNVTDMDDDMVSFGSAAPGSGIGANLVKEVFTKPYDLSILQVSDIIVPPGIENLQADTPAASSPPPTTNAPPPTTTTTTAPPPKTGTTTSTTTAPPPKTGTTTTAPPPKTGTTTTTTAAAPAPKSGSTTTSTPTPTAAPAKSSSPAAAPTKEATASAPSKTAPAPTKPAAAPTTTITSPSASPSSENAAAPTAETPSATTAPSASTEAPTSEAPQASSPTSAVADGPASDAAAPVTSESGAGRLVAGATAATLAMAVIISAF